MASESDFDSVAVSPQLDKFYTIPSVAKKCIDTIGNLYQWDQWDLIVEPSAGNGSFYNQLPESANDIKIGIDICPEHTDIQKMDFFDYIPNKSAKNILVLGNPPFGRVSSTAVKFFNYSAQWAHTIAFIIPRTFRKISIQNRLNLQFNLIHDEDIPLSPCSFTPPMMAKCCFQIWQKSYDIDGKPVFRQIIKLPTFHKDWTFVPFGPLDASNQPTPPTEKIDFALRAYGGKCGEIIRWPDTQSLRPKSWHWIKSNINVDGCGVDLLISRFKSLDYTLSQNTARQNSIGKSELVRLYTDSIDI
jgi:hypothetical protein